MQHVPYIAILAAYALIYVPRMGPVAASMKTQPGGYNNADPRAQQATLEGAAKRAVHAHYNGFEAFAPFAAGILGCMQRVPNVTLIAIISIIFVVARAGYIWAYISDQAYVRSGLWSIGMLSTTTLMVLAIIG
ncbi:MAPEG family protein [soil metagenome]